MLDIDKKINPQECEDLFFVGWISKGCVDVDEGGYEK
jgi:hypothetical protein